MKVQQFEDKALSHYAYAILSECEHIVVLIDPARDIRPYLVYAQQQGATIISVIETHPHADFVSGHLELHQSTGATIYCSELTGALYPHQSFDDGDTISFGKIILKAINTPGHSPDSICIVLEHEGVDKAVFTGDTLFIGDCGRPDLRENAGNLTAKREQLAAQMFDSLRQKLMVLADSVVVYPAHGAGTLCGKALSDANSSTVGAEKMSNWALQDMDEEKFIAELLADQPFIPKYFPYDVELNKKGAADLITSMGKVPVGEPVEWENNCLIIDARPEDQFKKGHLPGSVNLQSNGKFETWLGSMIAPGESFYLAAGNEEMLQTLIGRCAKIGYETFIKKAFVTEGGSQVQDVLDIDWFTRHACDYTIVDIRNTGEILKGVAFGNALTIPLPELRERIMEIPADKPIVVHCAGGYRSAAGSSLVAKAFAGKIKVYDLGESIKSFL